MSTNINSPAKKAKEYLEKECFHDNTTQDNLSVLVGELSVNSKEIDCNLISASEDGEQPPVPRKTANSDIRNFLISRQNLEYLEELVEERKANIENYPR